MYSKDSLTCPLIDKSLKEINFIYDEVLIIDLKQTNQRLCVDYHDPTVQPIVNNISTH